MVPVSVRVTTISKGSSKTVTVYKQSFEAFNLGLEFCIFNGTSNLLYDGSKICEIEISTWFSLNDFDLIDDFDNNKTTI